MNLQLIATDIDDTLIVSGRFLLPENVEALRAAHARGVRIVLATIRKRDSTELIGNLLNIPYAMICQGGATVYDTDGSCLYEASIDLELARQIASFADAHGIAMVTTTAETNIFVGDTQKRLVVVSDGLLASTNMEAMQAAPTRILIPGAREAQRIINTFREQPVCFSRHYRDGELLDVVLTAESVSKHQALTMLCERWSIPLEQVMALGDSESDIGMLRIAGFGVAMGNARADVQAAADWVAPHCAEAGVAVAVYKMVNAE